MLAESANRFVGTSAIALLLLASGGLAACSSSADREATSAASPDGPGSATAGTVRGGCFSKPPAAPAIAEAMPFPKTSRPAGSGEWQAVGMLTIEEPNGNVVSVCTGTLVGTETSIAANVASVVLTAKHCRNPMVPGNTMNFYVGTGQAFPTSGPLTRAMLINAGMRSYASTVQVPIGYGSFLDELNLGGVRTEGDDVDDLALVYLDYDVAGIKPLLLQRPASDDGDYPADFSRSSVQAVGYGDRGNSADRVKFLMPLNLRSQQWVVYRAVAKHIPILLYRYCSSGANELNSGDSGGPLIANLPNVGARVLGATSTGLWFERTDVTERYNQISAALDAISKGPRAPSYGNSCATLEANGAGASSGTGPTDPGTVGIR